MSPFVSKLQYIHRSAAAISLVALFALCSPVSALSQNGSVARQQQPTTTQQPSSTAQSSITQPLALSPEIGSKRVGVNEGEVQSLAIQDAIVMGLQNNLDIEQFRQGVQIAERNLY